MNAKSCAKTANSNLPSSSRLILGGAFLSRCLWKGWRKLAFLSAKPGSCKHSLQWKGNVMSKSQRFLLCAVLAAAGTVPAVPLTAQVEAPPDQFSDRQAAQRAVTKLKDQIAARRQELEGYYAALHRQLDAVEQARELAAGSGAMGDVAGMYIEAYRQEQR